MLSFWTYPCYIVSLKGQCFGLLNQKVSRYLSVTVTFPISAKQKPWMDNSAVSYHLQQVLMKDPFFCHPQTVSVGQGAMPFCLFTCCVFVKVERGEVGLASRTHDLLAAVLRFSGNLPGKAPSLLETKKGTARRHKSGAQIHIERILKDHLNPF